VDVPSRELLARASIGRQDIRTEPRLLSTFLIGIGVEPTRALQFSCAAVKRSNRVCRAAQYGKRWSLGFWRLHWTVIAMTVLLFSNLFVPQVNVSFVRLCFLWRFSRLFCAKNSNVSEIVFDKHMFHMHRAPVANCVFA
jgi:hypothetical protein